MESLSVLSDDDLFAEIQTGNKRAYEIIYSRYWKILFRHAKGMLQDEEEAKDVIQDVFITLWSKVGRNSVQTPLAPFLFRCTRNAVLNRLKRFDVAAKYESHIRHVIADPVLLPDSAVIESELARHIEDGIQSLPPKMRDVFVKSRKQYLSHKEISEQLNISDKTVKRQVSNALSILQAKLSFHKLLIYLLIFYIH